MIDYSVSIHDRFQFELNLTFNYQPDHKQTDYKIETYLFFPETLGVNESTFSKIDFYANIQNYIRLQSPVFLEEDLLNNGLEFLEKIEKHVAPSTGGLGIEAYRNLVHDLKIFSCAFETAIKTQITDMKMENRLSSDEFKRFLLDISTLLGEYRNLYCHFEQPQNTVDLISVYRHIDEYLSSVFSKCAFRGWELLGDEGGVIKDFLKQEEAYRILHNYQVLSTNSTREGFVYHQKMLKKTTWDVLHLKKEKHQQGKILSHLLIGASAGIAMIFATGITFYFQPKFGNFTTSFFVALVVGYMFKDRIKEILRFYLTNLMYASLDDYKTNILGGGKDIIGKFRERVSYLRPSTVDEDIIKARNASPIHFLIRDELKEIVIAYRSKVRIWDKIFQRSYKKLKTPGINDITRFNIAHFTKKMDDPNGYGYVLTTNGFKKIICPRVYHFNWVIKYSTHHQTPIIGRFRIILNRKGIIRIEKVF